jgi:hypothetical protein
VHVTVTWSKTSQQCYRHDEKRSVKRTQDTQHTAGFSCDRLIVEHTRRTLRMLLALVVCDSQLVLLHGNTRYFMVGHVIHTLTCLTTGAACSWDRKCNPRDTCECSRPRTARTPANETPQWQLWNDSREGAHENSDCHKRGFSKYFMTINGTHTTTHGAPIVVCGWNFSNGYGFNSLQSSSWYTTCFGQTKRL